MIGFHFSKFDLKSYLKNLTGCLAMIIVLILKNLFEFQILKFTIFLTTIQLEFRTEI